MKTIGIIVACEEERDVMIKSLKPIKSFIHRAYPTYIYIIENCKVILALSGVGECASASCTQYLISKYRCKLILNYGVCGTLTPHLELGEAVLLNGIVHADFDTSVIDKTPIGTHIELGFTTPIMSTNNAILTMVKNSNKDLQVVTCASTNKFISEKKDKDTLLSYGALVCEMEAAGIFLTCYKNHVPCVFIKAVSDNGTEEEYKNTITIASNRAFKILLSILKLFN